MLKVKDFFSQEKRELNKDINIYVCGPTTYDYPHIGNLRPLIIFDVFNRLASLENKVNYIHNITDIDDKIIESAKKANKEELEISNYYFEVYKDYINKLNVVVPTHMPKVSEHIPGMVKFVNSLVESGHAYEKNGSVYFSIEKSPNYGKIANLSLSELKQNEENNDDKKSQNDFALWKNTNEGIQFDSPWGQGRPGWHTECAYFIKEYFGDNGIDVHGGGIDLKFPHHVNEMAQYKAATGNELSKNWVYVGHIHMDDEKMSKSVGNVISVEEYFEKYSPASLRMLMYSTHYSKPINVTNDSINTAQDLLDKFNNIVKKAVIEISKNKEEEIRIEKKKDEKFIEILKDDLDIPNSITYLLELSKNINKNIEIKSTLEKLLFSLSLLGIEYRIDLDLMKEYREAYSKEDFKQADKLRERLVTYDNHR